MASRGLFVSDHDKVPQKQWLAGALRDRLASAKHVEVLSSLVSIRRIRVLEIRSRTGAILDALRRTYDAEVCALPMFESQQEIIRALYKIRADELIDFERFVIPYTESFNLIVSNHMFTHILHPGEFFAELHRHMAPGAYLYLYNEPDELDF